MTNKENQPVTKILAKSFPQKDIHGAISMPVYITAAFEFETAEEMEDAFLGKNGKHTYTRISNPTVEAFEARVQTASGAKHVMAVASGMAAISGVFMTVASAGSNIVTSPHLFGNTFSLFLFTLKEFGVEVRLCNLLDVREVEKQIDENTCAVFTEIITNPHMEIADLAALAEVSHKKGVPLIVDSTIVPWTSFKAPDFGVNLEVISSTKYISGGATSIGGLILDYQTFDWRQSKRLKSLAEKVGKRAFQVKFRAETGRNMGAVMAPQTAFLQNLGLETMELRFRQAAKTCLELALFLKKIPEIKQVNYNGLSSDPFHETSKKQFGDYPGAMLTFRLENRAACFAFINRLKIIRRATNLFDNKSLIIHPESTIYGTLSPEYKKIVEVPDNMLRLSVGLEDIEDLKADILQALIH
ncbi:MAG: aminotransferase class I/II-fold pyridoxal phosphate-dependent enzyme [Dysgonamonadaceae bacterium]|jgi:O-acetylhomoserine (thiol)-lyase|nr:aminotransferase class I/II-fold pyridoxal phosphate-dependent enzyme [Dysgonamonadaceae bacterium]